VNKYIYSPLCQTSSQQQLECSVVGEAYVTEKDLIL